MRKKHLPYVSMKLFTTIAALLLFSSMYAQVATTYTFSQSSGTYTPITGGTVLYSGTLANSIATVTIPSFTYDGTAYTTMYVSTNGWIAFSSNAVTATADYTPISGATAANGFIAPFGKRLNAANSGTPQLSWTTVGNNIIVQWQDVKRYATSGTITEDFSFQAWLNTATGDIQFVYSGVTGTSTVTTFPQIGLRGPTNTFATDVNNRLLTTGNAWTTTSAGTTNASTVAFDNTNGTVPAAGQIFMWTAPTPCSIQTLPLAQGFNATTRPSCWSQQFVTGTSAIQYVSSSNFPTTTPQEGTDYVYWNSFSYAAGQTTRLVSPPITSTGISSVDVSFYWYQENSPSYNSGAFLNEGVTLQYSLNGTTWTTVQFFPRQNSNLPSGSGQWQQEYITLPAAVGNQATFYVGFNFKSEFGDNCSMDHLDIIPTPPCGGRASGFTATSVTAYTATINWTAPILVPSNGYNWRIVPLDSPSTAVAIDSGSTAFGVDSALVTGLSPHTTYNFYVQSNCGSTLGVGLYVGPGTFTTPCIAFTIPWTEGFEGLGTNVGTDLLPPCWLPRPHQRWTTDDVPLAFANIGPRRGNNYLYDYYNANDTVFTPGFTLTGGTQYDFYFYYQTDGNTGWDSIFAMYGTGQYASGMSVRLDSVLINPVNTNYVKYEAIFTPATSGTYYFGVKLNSNFAVNDIAFDDFGLVAVAPCPNPPLAGIISGPNSACPSSTIQLSLNNYSPFTTIQWQTSTDSINFSDLVGANEDYINSLILGPSYFRAKIECADTSYTSVFAVHINSPVNCYCSSDLGGYCGSNNIDSVSILNTTFDVVNPPCVTNSQGVYTRFPATGNYTATLQRGGSYTLSLTIDNAYSISSAWVDYNQNGIYDPSEWVQVTTNSSYGTATLNVPVNAALGQVGMRIRTNYYFYTNDSTSACTYFYDGETFDFILTLTDTVCLVQPTVLPTITNVSCPGRNDGAITLGITGSYAPYTNRWSTGDTALTISGLPAGRYIDTILFNYGCTYIWQTDTVAQQAALVATTDSISGIRCFGTTTASIYTSASGGTPNYSNHWSNGASTPALINQPIGIYTDTVSDSRGCVVILGPDTISQPEPLAVVIDSTISEKCNGQSSGAIYISPSGGTPGYHFSWSNSASSQNLTNVPSGVYTVNITDTNGCTTSITDTITEPATLTITTDSIINARCATSSDGSIYVHVSGGTILFNYVWTGNINTFNLYLQPAGIYTLSIVDTNGCTASITDTITAPPALSVSGTATPQTFGSTLGTVTTTTTGGVAPYRYTWSNGDSTANISNLTAGTYMLTITDANGCQVVQWYTVSLIVTSVTDINADVREFNAYPNPSSGIVNVLVDLKQSVPVQLEVFDITGQQIALSIQSGTQSGLYQIDFTDQPSGIYLIKLTAGEYTSVRRVTVVK